MSENVIPTCAQHPWQSALGPCTRCGDFVCVRCIPGDRRQDGALLCAACSERNPEQRTERLPWDTDEPFLVGAFKTAARILRTPYTVFSRLEATSSASAPWYAWLCLAFQQAWSVLVGGSPISTDALARILFLPVVGALLHTTVVGLPCFVAVRIARTKAPLELCMRAAAFSVTWFLPANMAFAALRGLGVVPTTADALLQGVATLPGAIGVGYCLFALARGRLRLSAPAALIVALVPALPRVLLAIPAVLLR